MRLRKVPTVILDERLTWHEGLSANRVQRALNKFQVEELTEGFYRFNNINDEDVKLLLQSFGLNIEQKLYSAGELRKITSKLCDIK